MQCHEPPRRAVRVEEEAKATAAATSSQQLCTEDCCQKQKMQKDVASWAATVAAVVLSKYKPSTHRLPFNGAFEWFFNNSRTTSCRHWSLHRTSSKTLLSVSRCESLQQNFAQLLSLELDSKTGSQNKPA